MGIDVIIENIYGFNVAVELCCSLFTIALVIPSFVTRENKAGSNGYVYAQIAIVAAMIFDLIAYLTAGTGKYLAVFQCANTLTYISSVLYVVLFYQYLIQEGERYYNKIYKRRTKYWAVVYGIFISIVYASSNSSGMLFVITKNANYFTTEYSYLSTMMMLPIVFGLVFAVIDNWKMRSRHETIIYLAFLLSNFFVSVIDSMYTTTLTYIAITLFGSLFYIQEERKLENLLTQKNQEILASELNALRLQMNPHYIYNTLASIDGLCILDPKEARVLIARFIKHLRGSYLTDMPHKISIRKELENLGYYLDVERIRFPELKVKFDDQAPDFMIPPLVIQPLVENAIKHGICGRDESNGTVEIKTYESENNYHVKVLDDGVGFDINKMYQSEGGNHIGIINAKKRLKLLCDGEMQIQSIEGLGTSVEIIIPKEEKA